MKNTKPYLTVKDHSVSGEDFQLLINNRFGFLETYPPPLPDKLTEYYKTEDYISHTDTKRNLFEMAYHFVRSLALKRKLNLINSFSTEEKKLLDIGCGTGDFLQTIQQDNWMVSGIEPDENARQIANSKTNNVVSDIDQMTLFESHSFDVITLWHVLEHLPNLDEQISMLKRLLKKKGSLVIAVPNFKSFDANYYKEFWAAYDVPRHLWHFDKDAISKLFRAEKMRLVETRPMKFDSYYVSLLSEKYKSGRMKPFKSFWIGWRSNWKAKRSKNYSSLIYIFKNE
ncbi:MAG: class I SAM-dependent methyltransferase [Flavobacteriaceae bacterium]|nr:class I SAM-dependent methyltransferase [Flavobacteriaceae bacterium]